MIFPVGSAAEEQVLLGVRNLLKAQDIDAIVDGEERTPRTQIVIYGAEETRPRTSVTGDVGRMRWQAWRITLDILDDELGETRRGTDGTSPGAASIKAKLESAFDDDAWEERNAHGLFHAKLRSGADSRNGVEYSNPFTVETDTFTLS